MLINAQGHEVFESRLGELTLTEDLSTGALCWRCVLPVNDEQRVDDGEYSVAAQASTLPLNAKMRGGGWGYVR